MEKRSGFPNGYAIVIGVGTYKHEDIKNVESTANDAEDVVKVLTDREYCAFPEKQVIGPITNTEASRDNILKQMEVLFDKTERASNATVLIFLSGHGWFDKKKGEYFFLTHEAELELSERGKEKNVNEKTAI